MSIDICVNFFQIHREYERFLIIKMTFNLEFQGDCYFHESYIQDDYSLNMDSIYMCPGIIEG